MGWGGKKTSSAILDIVLGGVRGGLWGGGRRRQDGERGGEYQGKRITDREIEERRQRERIGDKMRGE